MNKWILIIFFFFLKNANAALTSVEIEDIKKDYQSRLTAQPPLTPLTYAQDLVKEGRKLIESSGSTIKDAEKKFETATHIIHGEVWPILERPANSEEQQQYFEIIGETSFYCKVVGKSLPVVHPVSSSMIDNHLKIVSSLYELAQDDEAVILNLSLATAKFPIDTPVLIPYLTTLRNLLPIKDAYFKSLIYQSSSKNFESIVGEFYREQDLGKRKEVGVFKKYLSDHHFLIGRDPKTGIVYVSWNTATQANTSLSEKPFTNSGFAITETPQDYQERLARISQVMALMVNCFGVDNTVFVLQEIKNSNESFNPLALLVEGLGRLTGKKYQSFSQPTFGTSFSQAILAAEGAFTISDLPTSSSPEAYKTEIEGRILARILQRTGSPLQTALFNLHLNWIKVNKQKGKDKADYDFAELTQTLMTLAKDLYSLAIMGDTNFEALATYNPPVEYVKIAPSDTSVAAKGAQYQTSQLKGIDFILFPKGG